MQPGEVGAHVLKAVLDNELYIITHGEWRAMAAARHAAQIAAMPEKLDPALLAMNCSPALRSPPRRPLSVAARRPEDP